MTDPRAQLGPIDAELPEQELAAQAHHRAGQAAGRPAGDRATGRRSAPGGAGRRIVEEARADRARRRSSCRCRRARRRRVAVRQDARDRAGRAAVPRDHRIRRPKRLRQWTNAAQAAPRPSHRDADPLHRDDPDRGRAGGHARSRWRRRDRRRGGSSSACCSSRRAARGSTSWPGRRWRRTASTSAGTSPGCASSARAAAFRRTLGSPALFAIVYTSVASAIYFSLGVVADHALGLTPVVFLLGGVFFALAAMTYVEGAVAAPGPRRRDGVRALRVQRAGELRRRLGDPARLRDPPRVSRRSRRRTTWRAFWSPLGARRGPRSCVAVAVIAVRGRRRNMRGFGAQRATRAGRS